MGNSLNRVHTMTYNLENFYMQQKKYLEKLKTAFLEVENKGSNLQNVNPLKYFSW